MKAAIKCNFRKIWSEAVLARVGIYSEAKVSKPPAQLRNVTRKEEVTIHQLRTGTSPLVRGCWARYAQRPEAERLCPNGCNIVEDVAHLFWDCPYYAAQRMRHFGTTSPERNILFGNPRPILKYLENTRPRPLHRTTMQQRWQNRERENQTYFMNKKHVFLLKIDGFWLILSYFVPLEWLKL